MNTEKKFKDPRWLEPTEIHLIVSRILPHLEGLSYNQAERVLNYVKGQFSNTVPDVKSFQKVCEESRGASCAQG